MRRIRRLVNIATSAVSVVRGAVNTARGKISNVRDTVKQFRTAVTNITEIVVETKAEIMRHKESTLAELNTALAGIRDEVEQLRKDSPDTAAHINADAETFYKVTAVLELEKEVIKAIAEIEICAAEITAEIECRELTAD